MDTYQELIAAGTPTRAAAALVGVPRATATRKPRIQTPAIRRGPSNRLTDAERARVLEVVNSKRFIDLAPIQIFAQLLDEGTYLCSISTLYRILTENAQVKERRRLARHPARAIPELVATAPGQVYSWDITKLAGPVKGIYFDCYVMLDIYSRYIIGAHVNDHESGELAVDLMKEIFGVHGIPNVVHADRGTAMTSKTVATLLADLQVTRSHSRPRVSNDNPYSEAWFKTMKFSPAFPERFATVQAAQTFMDVFVDSYNHIHRHTGIGLNTPADVHYGLASAKATARETTIAQARAQHPERFTTGSPIMPKILHTPDEAWINKPVKENDMILAA